jgi:hypothetical protein
MYWNDEMKCSRVTDIDIENCAVTILHQLCEKAKLDAPILRDYYLNKDMRQRQCMDVLYVTQKEAKHLFLLMMHGGDARLYTTENQKADLLHAATTFPYLQSFNKEQHALFPKLKAVYPNIWEETATALQESGSKNQRGVFIARLWQTFESGILKCMYEFYKLRGFVIEALMFDGLMLFVDEVSFLDEHYPTLDECQDFVKTRTGFDIHLTVKPMKPKPYDRQIGQPVANIYMERLDVEHCDDHYIRPFPPTRAWGDTKLFVVNAQLNMGKTHAIMQFISDVFPTLRNQRILFVTCRRQQARSIQDRTTNLKGHDNKAIPIFYYSESKKINLREKIGVFICQYESLHFMGEVFKSFSYVIIDEIRAVLAQVCVEQTNRSNLYVNGQILRGVLQQSRAIFTDADVFVDSTVRRFVDTIWAPNEVKYFNYTRNSLPRVVEVFDSTIHKETYHNILHGNIMCALAGDCAPVGIVCRAKSALDVIVKQYNDDARVMWVSGESPSHVMDGFRKINETLVSQNIRVLIFTSCVTVGTDIQVEFSNVYVIADAFGGAPARDIWQGAGRFRKLTAGGQIFLILRRQAKAPPLIIPTYESVLEDIQERGDERRKVLQSHSELLYDGSTEMFNFKLTHSWIKELLTSRVLESEMNDSKWFITTMLSHIIYKRFTLKV